MATPALAGDGDEFDRPRLVKIEDPVELAEVMAIIGSGIGPKVTTVFRVHNRGLDMAFKMCESNFRRATAPHSPVWAFHATTRQATGFIVQSGFNAHLAGKAHGTALGRGIYVATNPRFASGYAKADAKANNCMFVCEALPGESSQHHKKSGDQIVLFREQQVVPRYLAYYDA